MLNISFQNLSWLEEKEKEVVSALRYFKTIVDKMAIDKKVLEMLPGSASKVLEAILPLVQSDPRIQHRCVALKSSVSKQSRPRGTVVWGHFKPKVSRNDEASGGTGAHPRPHLSPDALPRLRPLFFKRPQHQGSSPIVRVRPQ